MLTSVNLVNYGPLSRLAWDNLDQINLVIGGNGIGKTFLLKSLYTAVRSLEEYRRGDDPRRLEDILVENIYWTFQVDKVGDLVRKNNHNPLAYKLSFDNQEQFKYSFNKDTTRRISVLENSAEPRGSNSVFLPAKEILSLYKVILKSRDLDKSFGFDNTYLDLARALRLPIRKDKISPGFTTARNDLETIIGGKIIYDESKDRWEYKQGNTRFPIGATAEGIKKIAIIDTLLGNGYLSPNSIVFIDEPEANLHPTAISKFLDIIALLAESGIQFFLATHSYFVIKKLFLIAAEKQMSIPLLAAEGDGWHSFDLKDGLPENEITNESIRLYLEEVDMALA